MSQVEQHAFQSGLARSDIALPTVLHITQPGSEGVANCVVASTSELAARGYTVEVVGPAGTPLEDGVRLAGLGFHPWHSSRRPTDGLQSDVANLRVIIERVQPAVVHLHSSKAGAAGRLALKARIPTVFQPHAWSFDAVTWPLAPAARQWERFATRWTDGLVTVSERERLDADRHGIGGRRTVTVIPNSVDTDRFRPPLPGEGRSRVESGPVVACIGRLCRQKGQDILLRAWPLVRMHVPSAKLLLVGEGPYRSRLDGRGDVSIELVGARDDTDHLLRQVDLVVMPSRWEGMSLAMLEAMATGLSVVATDVGGVAETVGRGAGAVVPVGDHRRLAEAMVQRLRSGRLRRHEGSVGRRLVLTRHSLPATTRQLEDVYWTVMGGQEPVDASSSDRRSVSR